MCADHRKPLRIAMVTDIYDTVRNGAAISTQRFTELLRKKHQVTLVTTGQPTKEKIVVKPLYIPFAKKILQKHEFCFASANSRVLHEVIARSDVVHVQLPFFLGKNALRIAKKLHVPVVATSHMQAEQMCYNIGVRSQWLTKQIYRVLIKWVYNQADHVVFPTKFAQEELFKYGFNRASTVISNGVLPLFQPQAKKTHPKDKFTILMVGRFSFEKRQDILINAIAKSRYKQDIQLILCGKGVRHAKLTEMGKLLPNPPVFTYLPVEELVDLYNRADLYVHASELETEGMTVLEAMACGVPLIVSDSGKSATKQFALCENALFRTNDSSDLANKIDFWYENREQLAQRKIEYQLAAKQYCIKHSVTQLEEVYYDVVN